MPVCRDLSFSEDNGSSSWVLKWATNCILGMLRILNVPQKGAPPVRTLPAALLSGPFEPPVIDGVEWNVWD